MTEMSNMITEQDKASLPASLVQKLAQDPATAWPGAPPGMGRIFPYHISTVSGRYGSQGRSYSLLNDEALRDNPENAQLMRTECSIMECLEARQRTTALLNWHIAPEDENVQWQKDLAENMTKIMQRIPRFIELRRCLLEAVWFGRYMTVHKMGIQYVGGTQRIGIQKWEPRHGDKIMFRYDDGSYQYNPDQVGIRVGPAYDLEPARKMPPGQDHRKVESTQHGLAYWFDYWERQCLALHKHMIEDGPFDDPKGANSINGVGIRSRIYWTWYAMQECLHMLLTFLERSALGVELWRFPMGNKKAEAETRRAAEERIGNGRSIVLIPVPPGDQANVYDVDHIEPGMSGAESIKNLLIEFFGHKIKRYILGQTLTSEADATGLGSGVADAHRATFADIVKYDARNLEETITTDIVHPLLTFNFPKRSGCYLRFVIDTESEESEAKLAAMAQAWAMGLEIKSEDLYSLVGSSKPRPGEESLMNPQIAQANAMMEQGGLLNMAGMMGQQPPGESNGNGNGVPIPASSSRYGAR